MTQPFDGLLPRGYDAELLEPIQSIWLVTDEEGREVTQALIDATIPLKSHIRYIWRKWYERATRPGSLQ